MKTALDLPDDLVREIKIEAARRGVKLKDLMAELLKAGLQSPSAQYARVASSPLTGLPVVLGTQNVTNGGGMDPKKMTELLLEQEVDWFVEVSRH